MSAIFLYGAWCDASLLRIVLGRESAPPIAAALPGHKVVWTPEQDFCELAPSALDAAPGLLIANANAQDLHRLDFYAQGLGQAARAVRPHIASAAQPATTWSVPRKAPPQGPAFDMDEWARYWGLVSREGAREAMEYFGAIGPEDLAGRMPMIRARAAARVAATGVPAQVRSGTDAGRVEQIEAQTLHAGFFRTEARILRHPTFDGGTSDVLRRELFVSTDAALVLPYDPRRDRVLLVEQFRMGPYGRGDPRPWMLEPVAGRIDAGETPEQAARRECREEAGLTLARLERIGSYYCTPGYSTEYFHSFVGIAELSGDLPRHGGLKTEAEDIRLHVLDFGAAMALLETGEADNGPLILSLMWLARERGRLRASA